MVLNCLLKKKTLNGNSVEESQSLNRYAYVNGDPISYHDPFGLARELLTRDNIQLALDFAGIVPGWGAIADITNAGIYAWNGEWSEAGQSAFGAIPVVGDVATVAKISNRASKIIDKAADSGKVRTRLPRSNGSWLGEPGNGEWYSTIKDVIDITKGKPVVFTNGRPDFTPWSKGSIHFDLGDLTGGRSDFTIAHKKLVSMTPHLKTQRQASSMLKDKGVTLHHKSNTELQMIPTKLHRNVPHIGSASDMRNLK